MSTSYAATPSASRFFVAVVLMAGCACTHPPLRVGPQFTGSLELPEPFARRGTQPVRALRVRAYADEAYRSQSASWRTRIAHQIDNASAVTEDEFGVRLEVESVRVWERGVEQGELGSVLDHLVRQDPGFGVDWVVGFTGQESPSEDRPDLVGCARWFGRHFVLRAVESTAPHTLFLHEWAHTLGAVHDCAGSWSMSIPYGIMRSAFSPESAWLVRLGLHYRDQRGAVSRREWARAYQAGAVRILAAWRGCDELEADLRRAHRLLFLASRAFVHIEETPVAPETPWERWVTAITTPLMERLNSAAERMRTRNPLPPHDPAERITVVSASFDRSGALKDVEVLLSSGFAPLDNAVVETVRGYSYPAPPPELAARDDYGFTWSFKMEL